jgi:GTP-binding protein
LNRPDYISRLAALVFPSIDVSIAARAVDEGRALVLLVNKLDRLHQRLHRDVIDGLDAIVKHVLPSARGLPILPISALERSNLDQILPAAIKQFDRWNTLIPTYKLNQWLREVTRQNPPPRLAGRSTRIRFIKQTHARPPHFGLFFSSTPDALPDSYVRYLTNRMRADFDLHGVPIRVTVRKSKNPYASTEVQRAQSMPKRIL